MCSICSMTIKKQNKRITLFINPSIAKQAKAQSVVDEISLTTLVEEALIKHLPKETVIKKVYIE